MRVQIDAFSAYLFTFRTSSTEHGDVRRYYSAQPPHRMLIVCRNGLDLLSLIGQIVDASIGNDPGWRDFVRPGNENHQHSKLTIYRALQNTHPKMTLAAILAQAPRDDTKERRFP